MKNLASKYGGSFVKSASHPELAAQYGNAGTSSTYTDSSMPGNAVINRVEKKPVSSTLNLKKLPEVADNTQCKVSVMLLVPAQNPLLLRLLCQFTR